MKTHETLDFDEEARRLFESLGIGEGEKRARFNNVDAGMVCCVLRYSSLWRRH